MFRRADRAGFDLELAVLDNLVGDLFDHMFKQEPQVRVRPVIRRRDVLDAIRVS